MVYAMIKDGVVENTIVADSEFVATQEENYDACVRIDEMETVPGVGWLYNEGEFTNPDGEEQPPAEPEGE